MATMATKLKQVSPSPIGEKINTLYQLREQIRALNEQLKPLDEHKRALEAEIIEDLDNTGIDKASGELATISISENVVPTVEDWDTFHRFIKRNNYFFLLERRAAAAAYRELLESRKGRTIPGVISFKRRTLNLRKR